ncbi:hypothetical protein [Xenorhabdus cabanillasii]|nr:hypothetical protein [Xenorhabdus cabanillasii]
MGNISATFVIKRFLQNLRLMLMSEFIQESGLLSVLSAVNRAEVDTI